jgi:hypothetical protein
MFARTLSLAIFGTAIGALGLVAAGGAQDAPTVPTQQIPTLPSKIRREQIPTPPAKVLIERIPTLPAKVLVERIPTLPVRVAPSEAIPTPPSKDKKPTMATWP